MLLLDTNICVYIINGSHPSVTSELKSHRADDLKVSVITVGELFFGIQKSQKREINELRLRKFLSPFEIIDFSGNDAIKYAEIRAALQKRGQIFGPYDLQIAAQGLSRSWTVVTNNEREFLRVEGLKVENWVKQS